MPQNAAKYRHHMKEKPKLDLSKVIISPMPGVVKSVAVEVGQVSKLDRFEERFSNFCIQA